MIPAMIPGTWPKEAEYLVQLLWCRGVGRFRQRFEEVADSLKGPVCHLRQRTRRFLVRTPFGVFKTAAEGIIVAWDKFCTSLQDLPDLSACFDALLAAGANSVFEPLAHAPLSELETRRRDFVHLVHAFLLDRRPEPSAETLELYK
jgi:hypothetical protein